MRMSPNKTKRGSEDSPEERKSKKKKQADDNEEEEEKEGTSTSSKMKIPSHLSSSHKPAELFRKDLISAMKLADSESLAAEDYLLIADSWRQEWERGVQVPVNEVGIPDVDLREIHGADKTTGDFKIPKKLLHSTKDETYRQGCHELTGMSQLAEQVVRYDLDDLDVCWLQRVNEEREEIGETMIHEWIVEKVIETLETKCHENMEIKKKTEEGLGIEYDEDIVCEICRSPDSEDCNEMVFCDGCDICVHQACYGIATVPDGSWLCRTCALGLKPPCILCPKTGGAMKSTRSGTKWAHVSCAIWIPEVTIGCVEKMEPITKISEIPASRWSLVCTICKERNGACIQCSVKACKTAFHVTCGFSANLEMKTILIEEGDDDEAVKLKAFCPKHSKKRERNASESEPDSPRKSVCGTPMKKEMTEEEKATLRAERLQRLEEEFYTVINVHEIATMLQLEENVIDLIYVYWKLKRKALFNRPLLTPKTEEADLLEKQQEDSLVARMKMFVHLRQDLERVRNLSYMISRREKMKRSFVKSRETVFYAALALLTDDSVELTEKDVQDVVTQYKCIPVQTSADKKSGKAKVKSKLTDIESESDSGFMKKLKSTHRRTLTYESDSDTVSVSSAMSSISPDALGDRRSKRTRKIGRPSDPTGPKIILVEAKPTSKVKDEAESVKSHSKVKSEHRRMSKGSKVEGDVERIKLSSPVRSEDTDEKMDTDLTESDLNNTADIDTSEVIDVEMVDDTLVKSELDTSKDETLKEDPDTSMCSVSEEKVIEEKKVTEESPNTAKRKGRPRKQKLNKLTETYLTSVAVDKDQVKDEPEERDAESIKQESEITSAKSVKLKSNRNEKSKVEKTVSTENICDEKVEASRPEMPSEKGAPHDKRKRLSLSKGKSSQKAAVKTEVNTDSYLSKTTIESPVKISDSRSLFDTIEKDLIDSLPSSRNIPKDVKAELCGYFRNNQLVVSDAIKQKVQSSLLNCRRNRLFGNGIRISAQKSFDSLFSSSGGETNNDTERTVSRVLNELSPTRDRLESNNLQLSKKLSDCDRISDRLRTRSSRDTSPDSHHGSDKSTGSLQRSDRLVRRSISRTSVGKDNEDDLTDVENIYEVGVKRKTRSMDVDEKKLKERSLSPATLLKKNTQKIIS